jgi:hypothetical protein
MGTLAMTVHGFAEAAGRTGALRAALLAGFSLPRQGCEDDDDDGGGVSLCEDGATAVPRADPAVAAFGLAANALEATRGQSDRCVNNRGSSELGFFILNFFII